MSNEKNNSSELTPRGDETIDLKELLLMALRNWKTIILSTFLTLVLAVLYIMFATPIYEVNSSIIIQDQSNSGSSGMGMAASAASGMMGGIDMGSLFSSSSSFDNELEILQSRSITLSTIEELDLYSSYYLRKPINDVELYLTSPVKVWLPFSDALLLENPAEFLFVKSGSGSIELEVTIGDSIYNKSINSLPYLFPSSFGTFAVTVCDSVAYQQWSSRDKILAVVSDPQSVAKAYMKELIIEPASKTTTVADISFRTAVRERGVDFINKLVEIYNRDVNEEKNITSSKSAEFIDERIAIINHELTLTEYRLENFKRKAGITDLESEAQMALLENAEYNRQSVQNNLQLQMVTYLKEYASNPKNKYSLMPVNIDMTNMALLELIMGYNELVFERSKLLRSSSESNPAVSNITVALDAMHEGVLSAIKSIEMGLGISQDFLQSEAEAFEARIANAPTTEREFLTISREREIQSSLYLMLLQMREENALTLAATINNARIFDQAYAERRPVAPRKIIVLAIALILGVGIPMSIIYIRETFKD